MIIKEKTGIVFNIQHFAVHDGPGIRTLVFFKGCPLRCWWCCNPEGQNVNIEIGYIKAHCKKCFRCVSVCSLRAINLIDETITINRTICDLCGKCVEHCNFGALKVFGNKLNFNTILNEIKIDEPFYRNSNGGVTFSGGEPLLQKDFLEDLLELCKNEGINTAVETSGFCDWEALQRITKYTDIFLFDIKHVIEKKHKQSTGVSCIPILENLKRLVNLYASINIRIPLIPGFNLDDKDLIQIMTFLSDTLDKKSSIHLLPFHKLGVPKYEQIGKNSLLYETSKIGKNQVEKAIDLVRKYGFKTMVGGTE